MRSAAHEYHGDESKPDLLSLADKLAMLSTDLELHCFSSNNYGEQFYRGHNGVGIEVNAKKAALIKKWRTALSAYQKARKGE